MVQCWNLGGIVVFLGVGHALHQWFGRVDRFFVRPNDRRFQIDAARLERNIDDLRDPALDGNGLVLVAQGRVRDAGHPRGARVEGVHALHVGHGPDGRACERHVDKRKRRPCFAVKDPAGHRGLGCGAEPQPPQHPCQQPRGQRARRLSCLRAIQMPISYSNNTGMDTRIWLVTSGGVMTAERAKMATNACLR